LETLLGALSAAPKLPGARCKGRSEWDSWDDPELVEYTLHQCTRCPAIELCENYFLSLRPSQRPVGVIAGRLNRPRKSLSA
jgi:WhiB family transcriptional regulator, redox-sensing transcriptional regulator